MRDEWDVPRDPLSALRDGEPGPFEAFVSSHAPVFLGFFQRLGAGHHQAEDMTQEVFLKLHQHAPRYRGESRFAAFCFRVARNVWIDHRRRRAVRPTALSLDGEGREDGGGGGLLESVADAGRGPEANLGVQEEAVRLRRALGALPEHHRLVFELGVIQELAYADIAEALEIPVGTVKSRMFHAVRRLRKALEPPPRRGGERT